MHVSVRLGLPIRTAEKAIEITFEIETKGKIKMKTKMNSKLKLGLNGMFTVMALVLGSSDSFAQAVPPINGDSAHTVVSDGNSNSPAPGQEVSPEEVAAKAQYCQYQYQWVCNGFGQCMYQYVWVCF